MAASALVQTRILGSVKEDAAAVLSAMGLTISDAVRMLLTKIATDRAFPFESFTPNALTVDAMLEARRGGLESFATVEDMMANLNATN